MTVTAEKTPTFAAVVNRLMNRLQSTSRCHRGRTSSLLPPRMARRGPVREPSRSMSRLLARPLLAVMTACAAPGSPTPYSGAVQSAADARLPPQISEPAELGWQRPLASPRPSWPQDSLLQRLAEVCGEHDQALSDAASRIALRQAHRQPPLDGLDLGLLLWSKGAPYVWPRTWSLSGRSLEPSRAIDSFARWLSRRHDGGVRRCGLARARNGSTW